MTNIGVVSPRRRQIPVTPMGPGGFITRDPPTKPPATMEEAVATLTEWALHYRAVRDDLKICFQTYEEAQTKWVHTEGELKSVRARFRETRIQLKTSMTEALNHEKAKHKKDNDKLNTEVKALNAKLIEMERSLASASRGPSSAMGGADGTLLLPAVGPSGRTVAHAVTPPPLWQLAQRRVIGSDGKIRAPLSPGAAVAVYAVLDATRQVQFCGYTADLTAQLTTLVARQPGACVYYAAAELAAEDPAAIASIVASWFTELGGVPPGHASHAALASWTHPVDAGDAPGAAEVLAAATASRLAERGLTSPVTWDANALASGLCDALVPSAAPEPRYSATWGLMPVDGRGAAPSGASLIASGIPTLASLPRRRVIGLDGRVEPSVMPGTELTAFAVYDLLGVLHFVGFSKDVRSTLLRLLVRQPTSCYTYAALHLAAVDTAHLVAIQQAWYTQGGGAPPGNAPDAEMAWTAPRDVGTPAAAADLAGRVAVALITRGLLETLECDAALLSQGKVEWADPAVGTPRAPRTALGLWRDEAASARNDLAAKRRVPVPGAARPEVTEVVSRGNDRAAWIAAWRAKTGGEGTQPARPAAANGHAANGVPVHAAIVNGAHAALVAKPAAQDIIWV